MQKFKYTAVDLQKHKIKGTFIAEDENDLAVQLAAQSLFLISCKAYKSDQFFCTWKLIKSKLTLHAC